MSLLVVQIPPRPRLHARDQPTGSGSPGVTALTEFAYVWSPDGRQVGQQGRCAMSLLPKADAVAAVVADVDLSWHRLLVPKAPAQRLRAALAGVLEEALLDEPALAHLALGPQTRAGETGWLAATHRPWLAAHLAALEQAQVFVDRVTPAVWPHETPQGHFSLLPDAAGSAEALHLSWADSAGIATLGLRGGLTRTLLPQPLPAQARFSATPAAAAAAEAWLGARVVLQTDAERLLQAAASPWDLRQFELVRRHRGTRVLRDIWRSVRSPAWRPARIGVIALVAVQLLGLNLWAWQLHRELGAKRKQMVTLLQTSFPQVRAVLDAPLQMQREIQVLRSQAGKVGEADLEALLLAAAAAWPAGRPPVDGLRFEPGRLSLAAAGWSPQDVAAFGAQLRAGGLIVDQADGRLNISRAARASRS